MTLYSFFIICNTNDDLDFHVECTCMPDYRLRFSAMKSAFNRKYKFYKKPMEMHMKQNVNSDANVKMNENTAPGYYRLFLENYVYYLLEKRIFCTPEAALNYRKKLICLYIFF